MNNTEALKVSVEMDAARALLQLHVEPPGSPDLPEPRTTPIRKPNRRSLPDFKYEIPFVPTTSTHLNSHGALDLKVKVTAGVTNHQYSKVGYSSPPAKEVVELPNGGFIIRNNKMNRYDQTRSTAYNAANGKHPHLNPTFFDEERNWIVGNKTGTRRLKHEVGTQTDYYDDPYEKLLAHVNELKATKAELEAELVYLQNQTLEIIGTTRSNSEEGSHLSSNASGSPRSKCARRMTDSSYTAPSLDTDDDSDFKEEEMSEDDDDKSEISPLTKQVSHTNVPTVPIGDGHARVPSRLLKQLDWSSYTNATRKLLTAVFPRKVLATHSLTGKPSPAFPGKKAKQRLDPDLVNDIIMTVMERCNTTEGHVRTSITTKCADESKMYRNRLQNKKKRRLSKKENVKPRASSSERSSIGGYY